MSAILSIDLWTSSKVIGRECASVSKDYLVCKKESGRGDISQSNPEACATQRQLVTACTTKIVSDLKTSYPVEFESFAKCLDYNDYRYDNCREAEKALHGCWNKRSS